MDTLELPFGPIEASNVDRFTTQTIDRNEDFMRQNRLFISGGIAACITSSFYNPLDCLRVRWQTLPQIKSQTLSSRGILHFTAHIIKSEGLINGLWRPGIGANATAMGCSAALRFGFYENVRDALYSSSSSSSQQEVQLQGEKKGIHMFIAGLSCGAFAYFITSPLHVMKTRLQVEANESISSQFGHNKNNLSSGQRHASGILENLKSIFDKEGVKGLWKGSSPVAARGALFTAGQMLGYDGFKTICKSNDIIEDGAKLHILSSVVAAFAATILSTPADFVMARYVSSSTSSSKSETVLECIKLIYKENGILGFWRGSGICFVRVCPVMLSYSTIYEQLRYYFGLGYLS